MGCCSDFVRCAQTLATTCLDRAEGFSQGYCSGSTCGGAEGDRVAIWYAAETLVQPQATASRALNANNISKAARSTARFATTTPSLTSTLPPRSAGL